MAESGCGISLLLYGLQSPINVGSVLRVSETFGISVDIWDEAGLFADPVKRDCIADFSCGAIDRGAFRLLGQCPEGTAETGRLIATSLAEDAVLLTEFHFLAGDRVAIGNEYDGLPKTFINAANLRLRIPMADVWTPKPVSRHPIDPSRAPRDTDDGAPVLSAAMAAGIIGYTAFIQSCADRLSPGHR